MPSSTETSARAFFARRLRELRVPKGFKTARSLAAALDIDENRYTRYERAEVEPDLGLLIKICRTLGVTPNDLMIDTGSQPAAKVAGWNGTPYGFAEDASDHPTPSRDAVPDAHTLKRRAVAWQIATLLARTEDGIPSDVAPGTGRELSAVARASRIFKQLERDPFGYVASIGTSPRLASLPPEQQRRLSAMIDDLLATYTADSGDRSSHA